MSNLFSSTIFETALQNPVILLVLALILILLGVIAGYLIGNTTLRSAVSGNIDNLERDKHIQKAVLDTVGLGIAVYDSKGALFCNETIFRLPDFLKGGLPKTLNNFLETFDNGNQLKSNYILSLENGVNLIVGNLDSLINWGRSNSLWSLTFATSCCGIEFMACGCARYDFARFGFEVTRNSPRQADLIMCAGTITHKMAPVLKRLHAEMATPKYVIAVGGCAISGGPFKKSYHVVKGIDEFLPVDVYIPGCPPRPEAILYGMMQLQRKVKVEKFFGGVNHKEDNPNPLVISDIPKNFINEMKKTAGEVKDFVKKEINDTFK